MIILLLCLAVIIPALVRRASRVPIRHRWRRQQARVTYRAHWGLERSQPSSPIYAVLRKMNALGIEPLLIEVGQGESRVVLDRRHTGNGGIDGLKVFMGCVWLIKTRRYGVALRPERVRAVAALGATLGSPGPRNHAGHTGGTGRESFPRRGTARDHLGAASAGVDLRRQPRDWRQVAVMPKLLLIHAALVAAIMVSPVAQARDKSTASPNRLIADCIHRSARGKPWLKQALQAMRDQEGGWIGAQVRNRNGSHDLGPMQINSRWVPRFAKLLAWPPVRVWQRLQQDACFNVEAARYILLSELDRSGHIWTAVGRYHSPVPWRQRRYIASVYSHLDR